MATRPARRTRVTLRCVREDLGVALPSVERDLGALDHPLIVEARRVAPSAPRGQKRILSIDSPLVYHATAAGDEIWVAIATQAADGRFVDERLRDVLFRLVFDAAEAELWEPRADWPSGDLAWFEVARLGLREPT
jgi:hypothetical protein